MRDGWDVEPARLARLRPLGRQANNASFGAQKAYDELVPGFEALFHSLGGDWDRFYDETRRLAKLPQAERHQYLKDKENGRA